MSPGRDAGDRYFGVMARVSSRGDNLIRVALKFVFFGHLETFGGGDAKVPGTWIQIVQI